MTSCFSMRRWSGVKLCAQNSFCKVLFISMFLFCPCKYSCQKTRITLYTHVAVSKMPKTSRKNEENKLFPQNQDSDNPGQKSLGKYCNIHIVLSFLGSLLKQLQFSLPRAYTKLKLGKNSGYTHPAFHCLWGEGRVGPV